MSDVGTVAGSAAGLAVAIKAAWEGGTWWLNWRSTRRDAEAKADTTEAGAIEKFQSIWGEEFERQKQQLQEIRTDFDRARSAWEEQRTDMRRDITHLESTVESLRDQIRALGQVPAA